MSDSEPATFYRQAHLQDRLTNLKGLIQETDGQALFQELHELLVPVFGEVERWLNRGEGAMTFEAQIALSNKANSGPTTDKNKIGNQLSYKV